MEEEEERRRRRRGGGGGEEEEEEQPFRVCQTGPEPFHAVTAGADEHRGARPCCRETSAPTCCPKNKNQMFERAPAAAESAVAHGDRPDPLKGSLPIGSDI